MLYISPTKKIGIYQLPQELINRIVELAVEEGVFLNNEKERRFILLNLSLSMHSFLKPSQEHLWKHLTRDVFTNKQFLHSIQKGFGKDKLVKRLAVSFSRPDDSNPTIIAREYAKFSNTLRRLKGIETLKLIGSEVASSIPFPSLFSSDSLKGMLCFSSS